ncbi:MAG TPA: CHAP domain-containing protein [Candidatus Saccharimonadales bacterium]
MISKTTVTSRIFGRAAIFAVTAVVALAAVVVPGVRADEYDEQIRALTEQNAQAGNSVNELQSQANSYQEAINQLQAQIDSVQGQISANQAEQAKLQQEIIDKQAQLDQQRALLAGDIKAMYVDGEMSAIEMLATSKNLSEYVDKEEYRNAVQQKIQDSLTLIAKLQSDLKIQEGQVAQLIENQKGQQAQLAAARAEQANMLAYTQAQKDQFTQQIAANSSKIADLKRQQIIANTRYNIGPAGTGVNCGGGYPAKWCNLPLDAVIDSWGMYNRECVSYTAFKVHQDYLAGRNTHDMPYWGGIGNANQWDENAQRAGIPVNNTPAVGSIAVSNTGYYGHVMYVEHVYDDGTILVSQYNAGWDGRYSEARKYTTGLVFIHF